MAKLLKERKDTGGFAIKGKGKGQVWKREVKKKKKRRRGKYNKGE